jgi:hypothetical protein
MNGPQNSRIELFRINFFLLLNSIIEFNLNSIDK